MANIYFDVMTPLLDCLPDYFIPLDLQIINKKSFFSFKESFNVLIFFSFCYFFFSLLITKEFVHKKEWGELYVIPG